MGPAFRHSRRGAFSAAAILCAVLPAGVGAVRLAVVVGDLWGDELMNLWLALDQIDSPVRIVGGAPYDNNHCLYTFILYVMGRVHPDWLYRLPAWAMGLGAVGAAAWAHRLQTREALGRATGSAGAASFDSVAAILLMGVSFLQVQLGSEARGYAPAVLFSLVAMAAALAGLERRRSPWALLYWSAAALALLAHALAVHAIVAIGAWSVVRLLRTCRPTAAIVRLLYWHAPPAGFSLWLYVIHLRHLQFSGGPAFDPVATVAEAAAYTAGLAVPPAPLLTLAVVALVFLTGLIVLWRRGSDLWVLYLVGVVASPMALFLITGHRQVYVRYFAVNAAMWLMLAAVLVGALWRIGRSGQAVAGMLLALFVAGNAIHTGRLLHNGRGRYTEVLRQIYAQTRTPVIFVGGDLHLRNRLMIQHHRGMIPQGVRVEYCRSPEQCRPGGPQWLVLTQAYRPHPPREVFVDFAGNRYRRVAVHPYGASPRALTLYRNLNP